MRGLSSYYVAWLPDPDSDLADLGRRLTGHDPEVGYETSPDPELCALFGAATPAPEGLMALLSDRLVSDGGARDWPMHTEMEMLAERVHAFTLPPLECRVEDRRIMLAPSRPSAELSGLIERIAMRLSRARVMYGANGSATAAYRPHKRADGSLSVPETPIALRVPLTDQLPEGTAERHLERISEGIAPVLAAPVRVSAITLLSDLGRGRFLRPVADFPLLDPSEGCGRVPVYGRSGLVGLGRGASLPTD